MDTYPHYTMIHSEDGDWVGLYDRQGNLLDEGHSFYPERIFELTGVPVVSREIDFESRNWGRCPKTLAEI